MAQTPEDPAALIARLQRATDALGRGLPAPPAPPALPALPRSGAVRVGNTGMAISVALVALAIASGRYALIVPGILIGIAAGITRLVAAGRKAVDPTRPHVGMGATVGEGARLEPGSRVGAGASIGEGAHLEPGAVVGTGASVGRRAVLKRDAKVSVGASVDDEAVLEAGAVVASGADVGRGATVGEGARVSSGASVGKGAYVPAGMRVRAGSTWNNTD